MSDQDRISPYNINKESSRQVRRIKKKNSIRGLRVDPIPNSPIKIISILWQTVGRITNEILGVERLVQRDRLIPCHLIQVCLYFTFHIVHSLQVSTNGTK